MTPSGIPESATPAEQSAREIVEYLRAHPSFLDDHPDLLVQLSIPHASGGAVSLVERQLAVLRADNERLKKQLDRLLTTARQNESLNTRIHELALTLMNATGPGAIFENLDRCLREDFRADHVASRIYADLNVPDDQSTSEFVGRESSGRMPFDAVISGEKTVCGELNSAQREALFGDHVGRLSAVTMPLAGLDWTGVLVIASDDVQRYQADMGTEFLTYLKDVVALVIDPWVKRPGAGR